MLRILPIISRSLLFCLLFCPVPTQAGDRAELLFSVNPFANPAAVHRTFSPLVEYLSKECGVRIRLKIVPNYVSHIQMLGSGQADLAFVGPSPYVRVKDKFGGIELLARLKMKNEINDRVMIISRRDSGLKSLADLKGKTFVFGDHQSFGSHFMPRWLLKQSGVMLKDFLAYDYAMSHDNVVLAVLHGDFSAGGVRQDVFLRYGDRPLKVLAGPIPIPPHAIVCRSSLEPNLRQRLRRTLLALRDPAVLEQINPDMEGFFPVADRDFNQARRVMALIESR